MIVHYLSIIDVVAIHDLQIERFGGADGLRDPGALESALFRPQSGYYKNIIQEAAALWESLSQNHPFVDGNKRTAFVATFTFLAFNNIEKYESSLMTDLVLVTGVSGFIASHVTAKLLEQGYTVRGTVRNKSKGQRIVDALADKGANTSKLELVEANLSDDTGWKTAVQDCRFVQHIASPFPLEAPSDREALVPAARAGAMRVIEQAIGTGAERVVMTSSMVSMVGQPGRGKHMLVKEGDWSNPDWKPLTAYPVSKTRAERAVWDYVEAQNVKTRLTTVCPSSKGFLAGNFRCYLVLPIRLLMCGIVHRYM